jgi:hypothetical protein
MFHEIDNRQFFLQPQSYHLVLQLCIQRHLFLFPGNLYACSSAYIKARAFILLVQGAVWGVKEIHSLTHSFIRTPQENKFAVFETLSIKILEHTAAAVATSVINHCQKASTKATKFQLHLSHRL